MPRFISCLFALSMLLPCAASAQQDAAPPPATEERQADHDALRVLMKHAVEALTTRNFEVIAPHLHRNFTAITVDNRKLTSLDEFKSYWNGLFSGPQALLSKIEVRPEADELTQFLDDDTGITHGSSSDVYHFTDGDVRTMRSRWTAVVKKEPDGWKLAKVHFSANLLDNPVLDATKSFAYKAGAGGLIVGLILGAVLATAMGRRRVN